MEGKCRSDANEVNGHAKTLACHEENKQVDATLYMDNLLSSFL